MRYIVKYVALTLNINTKAINPIGTAIPIVTSHQWPVSKSTSPIAISRKKITSKNIQVIVIPTAHFSKKLSGNVFIMLVPSLFPDTKYLYKF